MSRSPSAYRMPIAAVGAPTAMVTTPVQAGPPGSSWNANSAMPYTPNR